MRIGVLENTGPGGAARMTEEVVCRLAATDDVVCCTWSDDPPDVRRVPTIWTPAFGHLPPPLHPFGDVLRGELGGRRAAAAVEGWGVDVALVFPCRWTQAPCVLRHLSVPCLYFAQEGRRRSLEKGYQPWTDRQGARGLLWSLGRRPYDALAKAADARNIAQADAVATNSTHSASQLRAAYGVDPRVVHLGVDADAFHHDPEVANQGYALLVGALDPTKGGELAVESLAIMPAASRPRLLLVANRGQEAWGHQLRELGASKGVSVEIRMSLTEGELVRAYQGAAVVLALALNEPFGLTTIEAGACGIPVVAVRSGGFLETVEHGRTGLLVDPEPAAVAAGLEEVLSSDLWTLRSALAAQASRWSWEGCVAGIRAELERLVRGGR